MITLNFIIGVFTNEQDQVVKKNKQIIVAQRNLRKLRLVISVTISIWDILMQQMVLNQDNGVFLKLGAGRNCLQFRATNSPESK